MGEGTVSADLETIVKAVGVKEQNIRMIDPYDLGETQEAIRAAHDASELFVIISKRPCALIKEVQKQRANIKCTIDPKKCKRCKACIKTGCPAIAFKDGQVVIDKVSCNGCSLCKQVCEFNAIDKVGE